MSGIVQALIGSLKAAAAVATDAFFKYVTLLLPGNGTNGAQNNTFIDASTNNFSITRNGNTTQGTFTPFGDNWSNYFDGTGDYLAAPSDAAFNFGTGDYCIEAWVYLTAHGTGPSGAYSLLFSSSGVNNYWAVLSTGGNVWLQAYDGSTAPQQSSGSQLQLNTWNHVAYVKNSGNFSMYLNGTSVYSASLASSWGATAAFNIGASPTSYPGHYLVNGYMSNVRVVKGSPVYTANFTPPTSPLTAITNTSLLTCQSNRFVDNSTNAFTITRSGDVSVQRFSPFSPTAAYSASVIGGSGYFDGTGDYLTAPSNTAFEFSSGNFTVECWVYFSSVASAQYVIAGNPGTSVNWTFYTAATGTLNYYLSSNGTTWDIASAVLIGNISVGQWYHVALVRNGNTFTPYFNGVAGTTTTSSAAIFSGSQPVYLGGVGSSYFTGYISNARIVKGTAVYTAAFTPPTAPLTAITNTSLLLNFTNAGIIDNAMLNNLETVGNAQISTAQSKFGGSSMLFDEVGDYLTVPVSANMSLGTGDFTIECWVRFAVSTVGNGQGIYQLSNGYLNSAVRGPGLGVENSVGDWTIYHGTTFAQSGTVPTAGVWYHTAVVRSSGTTKLYVGGTSIISVADTTNYTDQYFVIGGWYSTGFLFNGYIDDLRITKGVARYTATFTPPAAAFPTS